MKISLIVIGKTEREYLAKGINEYSKRINHYIPFEINYINDLKNTKNLSRDQQKDMEGNLIMKNIDNSDYVVLLDERGKELSSMEFAKYLEKKFITVPKRIVFIVGGPYGFSQTIYNRSSEKISLSKMTFPHDLIRLIFIEQLYRSMTILKNEPYHHE